MFAAVLAAAFLTAGPCPTCPGGSCQLPKAAPAAPAVVVRAAAPAAATTTVRVKTTTRVGLFARIRAHRSGCGCN